jgi:hypothetical protein
VHCGACSTCALGLRTMHEVQFGGAEVAGGAANMMEVGRCLDLSGVCRNTCRLVVLKGQQNVDSASVDFGQKQLDWIFTTLQAKCLPEMALWLM